MRPSPRTASTADRAEPPAPARRSRLPRRGRVLAGLALLAGLAAAALLLPLPDPVRVREWAESVGPWAPLAFVGLYTVITVAPVPRTVFTLASGLLFGPVVGSVVSLVSTNLAALLAFGLVRAGIGRDLVAAHLDRPAVRRIDERLRRRGWLAVTSLRLIPVVPFPLLNYSSALSPLRLAHFAGGTAVGIVPGTVAAVVLGDALTGETDPALVVVSLVCGTLGVLGLVADNRAPVRS